MEEKDKKKEYNQEYESENGLRFKETIIYDYRPVVHFTAPKNWINDPNGMVYIDGKYHLFYQHYPDAPHWGPMHWGHAVSKDLLHWENLPIALYPDELGCIFSGSCIYDFANVSGLGKPNGKNPLIAFFTSHSMDGKHTEHQSMAYSTDYSHFEKFYGNPVIKNPGQKDFRDPKAFWNPIKNCYSIVLAAGDHVDFYASKNLKEWEKTGEFKAGVNGIGGICECPDCIPLKTSDGEKWVLIISMIIPTDKVGIKDDNSDRMTHITQYYVGTFDGDTFHDTEKADEPLLIDYGTDNYAPVSFQNLEEKVLMGWADNWDYANFAPTELNGYRGMMTLARRMELAKTSVGYRLAFSNEALEEYRCSAYPLSVGENRLRSQVFGLKVKVSGNGSIILRNHLGEHIDIILKDDEIIVDRIHAGQKDFHKTYAKDSYGYNHAPRLAGKDSEMEIILDKCILEVLADDGLAAFTARVFPTCHYEKVCIEGDLSVVYFGLK
jgi:fructan beta-fructosidase